MLVMAGVCCTGLPDCTQAERIVWFVQKPKAAEVLKAAERWGRVG